MLIKVTALSKSTNVSTVSFGKPVIATINPFKIITAIPLDNGKTEVLMDNCILTIKETPEELYELENGAMV